MRCGFAKEPLAISENGEYDVKGYARVRVDVEGGDYVPVGELETIDTITWAALRSKLSTAAGRAEIEGKTYYIEPPTA